MWVKIGSVFSPQSSFSLLRPEPQPGMGSFGYLPSRLLKFRYDFAAIGNQDFLPGADHPDIFAEAILEFTNSYSFHTPNVGSSGYIVN